MTELVPGIVLDTNIVLDLLVFKDPLTLPLCEALETGQLRWLSTDAMREELDRVLAYPQIAKRLAFYGLDPQDVLAARDAWVLTVDPAPKAPVTCKDPDDQRFIDLAVAHRCLVLSKDHAVLSMAKRLLALGASARAAI
ncbi:tRNA(fMet)-specific endonuclease VapC [Curvibacter sp. AEP1-3]|uniref:putative toxin-antitoxin system toxin component, PIN family n=1 Tax=Curvibacter sp. AEP1-3 TaxID=1844971 RepID=UPI000B3C2F1E|nr:putative toxin-antitoxin system toxin component, PIN family [Curvibacter sp. AEP1-3]ARV19041.1 tRNA(fMet)-specific endonuclease VapC [Curvibacter sp. AEP1-3]